MRSSVLITIAFVAPIVASAAPAWASEVALGQSGGIYTVPGQVNRSVTLQFLVDPGSAVVVIPRTALRALVANGTVSENDVVGVSIAELADRSLYQTARIRLRELRVGNDVAHDVIAAVSPGLSHPLLGQSFLRRFASVTIDNTRGVLILSGQGPEAGGFAAAARQYPAQTASPYYYGPPAGYYGPSSPPGYWTPAR
jgi:predicted aspartyl protease